MAVYDRVKMGNSVDDARKVGIAFCKQWPGRKQIREVNKVQ
jgi:hypothetical protein